MSALDNILTVDSAAAITCLENDILQATSIIELIKSGKLVAVYNGNREEPYDAEKFLILTKGEYEKRTKTETFVASLNAKMDELK